MTALIEDLGSLSDHTGINLTVVLYLAIGYEMNHLPCHKECLVHPQENHPPSQCQSTALIALLGFGVL